MTRNKLIWGADPEAFSVYKVDGELNALPPYYFRKILGVPASDDPKHPVFISSKDFKLHEDGAAFEMTIKPSFSPKEVWDSIQECASAADAQILGQFSDECSPILRFLPSVGWQVERWKNMPEDFFMSTRFGCDPSQDAWNLSKKSSVIDASLHPWRYGGGHIHISGSEYLAEDPILGIRCLSVTAGCAAIAFSDVPDLEKFRTFEYGVPGNFRIQRYGKKNPFGPEYAVGAEYRTISNRWCSDWNLAKEIFTWAEIGIRNLLEGGLHNEILEITGEPAQTAILECNQGLAKEILSYIQERI